MEFVFSSARELFQETRKAASDLSSISARIGWTGLKGIDYSDEKIIAPTMDGQDSIVKAIEQAANFVERANEARACMDFCLKVLYGVERSGGVASLLSNTHADVCAWHYVGLESWEEVASKANLSRSTAKRYASEVCDMIDARGLHNTIAGRGMAT